MTRPDQLLKTLSLELPLSLALGVEVREAEPGSVVLAAPLEPNRNHRGSAFAGSLNALATLAGWSWLWWYLRDHSVDATVVLQDSSIRYQRPVRSDFVATCHAPSELAISRLRGALTRSGRGRLALEVIISDRDGPAVTFSGRYVVEGPVKSP